MSSPGKAYKDFQSSLRRYLVRRLDDTDDVDEVLQDVFLKVTRNRDALADAKEPLAWLYSVAKSALIDHQRRVRKHAAVTTGGVPEDIPDTSAGTPSVRDAGSKPAALGQGDGFPVSHHDVVEHPHVQKG